MFIYNRRLLFHSADCHSKLGRQLKAGKPLQAQSLSTFSRGTVALFINQGGKETSKRTWQTDLLDGPQHISGTYVSWREAGAGKVLATFRKLHPMWGPTMGKRWGIYQRWECAIRGISWCPQNTFLMEPTSSKRGTHFQTNLARGASINSPSIAQRHLLSNLRKY